MSLFLAFLLHQRMFDTADIADAGSADTADSPSADAGESDAAPPAEDSTPPVDGSGADSPPAESGNIKQLRDAYEGLKKQFEPLSKLGDAATVQQQVETFNAVRPFVEDIAIQAGIKLGYSEEQVRNSLEEDFSGTIEFLRGKQVAAEKKDGAESSPELKDALEKIKSLENDIKPLKEGQRQQKINEAQSAFESVFNQQMSELYKGTKLEEKEESFVWKSAFNLLSGDKKAFKSLVEEGKTADVIKYIKQAKDELDVYYLTRAAREKKRTPKPGEPATEKESSSKYTLDDLARGKEPPKDDPFYEIWKSQAE